jgi:plasmid stabilization system protein ParE
MAGCGMNSRTQVPNQRLEGTPNKITDPARWRVAEEPGIRRYVFRRFPYVIYYRWEVERHHVTIYAVMHCSREPGYWKNRAA